MSIEQTLESLARAIGADLHAASDAERRLPIRGVMTLDRAGPAEISFLTNPKYAAKLKDTRAAAVILGAAREDLHLPQLIHRNPYAAMAKASTLFYQRRRTFEGQSEQAFVHPTATVDASATLFPFCYIDEGVTVGAGTTIYPHVYIGAGARIGARTLIFPNASIMEGCTIGDDVIIHSGAVIGGDGFGFAPTREGIEKIPQIGAVVIGNACEIGPGCTIDRGAFTDTVLARGCKLDSQVHVAHGVEIGEFALIAGGCGIAGSAKIGKRLIMAGHGAIGPSLEVPDNIVMGPKAGMTRAPDTGGEYMGMPLVPMKSWLRQRAALEKLPELLKTVGALRRELDALKVASEQKTT